MKNVRSKLLFFVSFILLMSCNGQTTVDDAVKQLYGKKIKLDWNNLVVTGPENTDIETIKQAPFKIVTLFDEDSCTTCFMGHLEACITYYNTLPKDSVSYICVVPIESQIIQLALQYFDTSGLTIISDADNSYTRKNRIEKYNTFFCSYLLDSNDKIILVGDPIRNSNVRKLYNKTIRETANK